MSVVISDKIIEAAHLTPEELKLEIAVLLYRRGGLTLAQASRFAEINRLQFQHLLASRQIPINYDTVEFESDLQTLDRLAQ